jgi:hypothetical protein|tara:strand:+ start:782 stop:1297 length:516 start_codon:yes stop_codon:yes gene_type:complete
MNDLKSKIKEADGSYKVYVAVKGDPKLEGKFHCTKKGTLYFNGKVMNDPDFSQISVYLAKEWQVAVSHEDLRMGLMACSKAIDPTVIYGVDVSKDFKQKVIEWLEGNPPSPHCYEITTEAVSAAVDPGGYQHQRRLTEMRVARVLREQGLQKARVSYNGERKMRWFPINQE